MNLGKSLVERYALSDLKLYTTDCVVIVYVNTGLFNRERSHFLYLKLFEGLFLP